LKKTKPDFAFSPRFAMVPVMFHARTILRIALTVALAASLGLAACGRKGPLDPPPAASLAGDQAAPASAPIQNNNAGVNSEGRAIAPAGPKKSIPLDVLLN
jgi:predicted small lipoprotein YifL